MNFVLFDGDCSFCQVNVQFILRFERSAYFHFASLQSEVGQALCERYDITDTTSVVVIDQNKAYTKSDAALQITKHLRYFWVLRGLSIVPRFLRDIVYEVIAINRKHLPGACLVPTATQRARFHEKR